MHQRLLSRFRVPLLGIFAFASALASSGCEEDVVELLFEEEGVWEMTHQDVGGSGQMLRLEQGRQGKFFLKFARASIDANEAKGTLMAAACIDSDNTISPALGTTCGENYCCRCYSYSYNNNFMRIADSTPEGGQACDVDPGDPTDISLEPLGDFSNTFTFTPFQQDMFACEGDTCSFGFQGGRANSKFEVTGCEEFCAGG